MVPMALSLGIKAARAGSIPARVSALELGLQTVAGKPTVLPPRHSYIGQASHRHQLARTKWASPFMPGRHSSASECVALEKVDGISLAFDTEGESSNSYSRSKAINVALRPCSHRPKSMSIVLLSHT